MTTAKTQTAAPIPGVIATLAAGVDVTLRHPWLVLLPVLLDTFLWLGPRLSIQAVVERHLAIPEAAEMFGQLPEQMVEAAQQINLFTSLRLPLIGVPALMSGPIPETTPLPTATTEVSNLGLWLLWFVALSLAGLLLTTVYFSLIAEAVRGGRLAAGQFIPRLFPAWARLLGLIAAYLLCLLVISLPLLPVAGLLSAFSGGVASAVMLLGVTLAIWVAIYLSFTLHGVLLGGRPLRRSLGESLLLVRRNTWATMILYVLIVLIGSGLNRVWRLPADGTWLNLAGILGHAFISTALAAATFIFYRDRFPTIPESKT